MQKDVIYIDTEDDITAIIGKVKAAEHHIVALVPPKRIGAIQSVVNLKLVRRVAEQVDKRLVIISNNTALIALASSAGIPVARNLQSKPELAEIPALEIDDGDDVIEGDASILSVDELEPGVVAATTDNAGMPADESPLATKPNVNTLNASLGAAALAAKGRVKIPNFDSFRKKLFIMLAALVLVVGFLIWAIVFAPRADIVITAQTNDFVLSTQVKLADDATTSLNGGAIKTLTKTSTKSVSIPFTATGQKDEGTKATGTVQFLTSQISALDTTIPAGTTLASSSGATYTTDNSVTITKDGKYGDASCGITSTANGTKYNGATGAMSGAPSGISANISSVTAGGTDKTVTVVQQSDIDAVSGNVVSQSDSDAAQKVLKSQFGNDYVVLNDSYKTNTSNVRPTPAVGAEADSGSGTFAGNVTFSLVGVPKTELSTFLNAYFAQQIDGKPGQKVYDNGLAGVTFASASTASDGFTATITANGKIGPMIDETALKNYAKGKKYGDIQNYVEQTNGVDNVSVKFSPFWVTSAPNNVNKIQVEFKVNGQ